MYRKRHFSKLENKPVWWSFGWLTYRGVLTGDVVVDTTDKQVSFHVKSEVMTVGYLPKDSIILADKE